MIYLAIQALYLPSSYLSIHSSIFSLIRVTLNVTKYPSIVSVCPSTSCIYPSIHSFFLPPSVHPSLLAFILSIHTSCLSIFSPSQSGSHVQMTLPSQEHPSIRGDVSGRHNSQEWPHWHVMGGDQGCCSYTAQGSGRPASEGRAARMPAVLRRRSPAQAWLSDYLSTCAICQSSQSMDLLIVSTHLFYLSIHHPSVHPSII